MSKKNILSRQAREDLNEAAGSTIFKMMPTIGKAMQRKVRPGVTVVVKWLDAMPTVELVIAVESEDGRYDGDATVELFNIAKSYKHRMATCDQIVAVVGQLA